MNEIQSQKHDFETIAWGAFFIWWGITELFPALPTVGSARHRVDPARIECRAALFRHSHQPLFNHVGILALYGAGWSWQACS